jgi:diguanylate cyclase
MISIKRYLDMSLDKQDSSKSPCVSFVAYHATLEAVSEGALHACPSTGAVLQRELEHAMSPLKREFSGKLFKTAQLQVLKSLHSWGEQSEAYFARKTAEIKEILTELAGTAESIGSRDQRYTRQFQEISSNLQGLAQLDDLGRIKTSLIRSAGELKSCVDRMARESGETVAQLQASLASHRVELEQARELATLDPLTGLYNRREVEHRIARKLSSETPFCVVIIDLHDFKLINEHHGNEAGDELLRQITHELRMASRNEDILGRWGGDEFILVLDGTLSATRTKMQRMRPWVFGNYDLEVRGEKVAVVVKASMGIAEWAPGDTAQQLLARAVEEIYRINSLR